MTPLRVDWSYCSAAVTEAECWILKEIHALDAVLIVTVVAVVVAVVVVLFVLLPVVASPTGDCERKSAYFYQYQADFPVGGGGGSEGILLRTQFKIEVLGNGISSILRPIQRVIMSHLFNLRGPTESPDTPPPLDTPPISKVKVCIGPCPIPPSLSSFQYYKYF